MPLDLSQDYKVWDFPEAVRYETSRGAQPDPLAVDQTLGPPVLDTIPVAKRRAIQGRERFPTGGVYVGNDIRWFLPQAVLPAGLAPKAGDVIITDDGTRWTAFEANFNKVRQTWQLTTRNLVLAFDLRDSIDVQRPGLSRDGAGAVVRVWPPNGAASTPYAAVPARVQLAREEPEDQRGIRGMVRRYEVVVGRQMAVTLEDRLAWTPSGAAAPRYLDVTGYRQAELVTDLPVIEAVLKP